MGLGGCVFEPGIGAGIGRRPLPSIYDVGIGSFEDFFGDCPFLTFFFVLNFLM